MAETGAPKLEKLEKRECFMALRFERDSDPTDRESFLILGIEFEVGVVEETEVEVVGETGGGEDDEKKEDDERKEDEEDE